jgi:hypothetical protein
LHGVVSRGAILVKAELHARDPEAMVLEKLEK